MNWETWVAVRGFTGSNLEYLGVYNFYDWYNRGFTGGARNGEILATPRWRKEGAGENYYTVSFHGGFTWDVGLGLYTCNPRIVKNPAGYYATKTESFSAAATDDEIYALLLGSYSKDAQTGIVSMTIKAPLPLYRPDGRF